MRANLFIIFIITFKIKYALAPVYINTWVLWNIGQGQWLTHILSDECVHYDVGGEAGSIKNIEKNLLTLCGKKLNKINLSHWDYDHFTNILPLAKKIPELCWQNVPHYGFNKKMAQKVLQLNLPYCKNENLNVQSWVYTKPKNTNESSKVFIDQKILIPADSPVKQEKLWANEMTGLINVEIIILGHHGSRTSTSTELLLKLKNIKMAMVSARYAKYKHPHLQVLNNLMEFGIPVLKTEDWGNIWFTSN